MCFYSHVIGFDIDSDALDIAKENNDNLGTSVDFAMANIDKDFIIPISDKKPFDIIVSNPPFGTKKNVGIDARFVQRALQLAPVVYSLHKSSTRKVRRHSALRRKNKSCIHNANSVNMLCAIMQ